MRLVSFGFNPRGVVLGFDRQRLRCFAFRSWLWAFVSRFRSFVSRHRALALPAGDFVAAGAFGGADFLGEAELFQQALVLAVEARFVER